jgi:hypothetical protein
LDLSGSSSACLSLGPPTAIDDNANCTPLRQCRDCAGMHRFVKNVVFHRFLHHLQIDKSGCVWCGDVDDAHDGVCVDGLSCENVGITAFSKACTSATWYRDEQSSRIDFRCFPTKIHYFIVVQWNKQRQLLRNSNVRLQTLKSTTNGSLILFIVCFFFKKNIKTLYIVNRVQKENNLQAVELFVHHGLVETTLCIFEFLHFFYY